MTTLLTFAATLLIVIAQPAPVGSAPPAPPTGPSRIEAAFGPRLRALDPARPAAYLTLAEDVADEDTSPEARALAQALFTFAALLPRTRVPSTPSDATTDAPDWLAASACLGLASLARSEQERRWLTALAGTLSPAHTAGDGQGPTANRSDSVSRDAAALGLATAIGMVRVGEGRRAQRLLDSPAVASMLGSYERLLSPGGLSGGAERVRSLAGRSGPCVQCHNRRVIKDADGVRLCPSCQGRPGPKLSVPEVVAQLRLESLLLNGIQRSWAAQVVTDGGAPMRELDPSLLVDVYGVDLSRPVWRDGAWAAEASGSAAEPHAE